MKYLLVLSLGCAALHAHDPITTKITFSKEIVRVFQKRCVGCHKEGGAAPMSLANYAEARPWAKAIKEEVLERRMPPWGAVKGFGSFRHEQALTQEEVSLIADWVEGGAPEGDPKYLPALPLPEAAKTALLKGARQMVISTITLAAPITIVALAPQAKGEVASVRLTAEHRDGGVEPLLWLRNYKPQWRRTFELRTPLRLPAGSRLVVEPPGTPITVYTRP